MIGAKEVSGQNPELLTWHAATSAHLFFLKKKKKKKKKKKNFEAGLFRFRVASIVFPPILFPLPLSALSRRLSFLPPSHLKILVAASPSPPPSHLSLSPRPSRLSLSPGPSRLSLSLSPSRLSLSLPVRRASLSLASLSLTPVRDLRRPTRDEKNGSWCPVLRRP
jgi:hypothetical protein